MKGNMLIQNGTMYLQKKKEVGDLRIKSGVISAIATGGGLEPNGKEVVIDATGLHLLPGAIDPHVHFRTLVNPRKKIWSLVVGQLPQRHYFISRHAKHIPNA